MKTSIPARAVLAALLTVATLGVAHAAPPAYRVVELPFPGPPDDPYNDTSSVGINKTSRAAVNFYGPYGQSGMSCSRYDCVGVPPLYIPHWPVVWANAINDAGTVLATSADMANTTHALVFDGQNASRISGLPDDYCGGCANDSYGHGLNNKGHVVGSAFGADGRQRAFVSRGAGVEELGTLGGAVSVATAINDRGDIVGFATTPFEVIHAFMLRRSKLVDLGTLGGDWAEARAINDARQVTGCSTRADGQTRAFLYSAGAMQELPALGGGSACGLAINGLGQIVGSADTSAGETHAFVYDGEQAFDLNDLLISKNDRAKWRVIGAAGINDKGVIAATVENRSNGVVRAVLLRPKDATL